MSPEQAAAEIASKLAVTREDIARAKSWLSAGKSGRTTDLCTQWLSEQTVTLATQVETNSPTCSETLSTVARGYSLTLAFYQAVWECVGIGALLPGPAFSQWEPHLAYKTPHMAGGIDLKQLRCPIPDQIQPSPFRTSEPADSDVFLKGIDCSTLHPGIREAVDQSLTCFRRGLYMPATAMLAAAAEATWTECGSAVAKKLSDSKLSTVVTDPYASISKKVTETRKTLEAAKGKQLLKTANRTVADITNAELWTTALRDRRNALHWTKAKSFVADHSDTAGLLMGAPMHIGTLEAIRSAC